jgi:hypothetical protein
MAVTAEAGVMRSRAFVATQGFLVQVPYRTPYELQTVGDEPSGAPRDGKEFAR